MSFEQDLYTLTIWLGIASAGLVFYLSAMAWQRFSHRAFFLLALSSMLTLLLQVMDQVAVRQFLDQASYSQYWLCRTTVLAADCFLYPWSIIELFRFIKERITDR